MLLGQDWGTVEDLCALKVTLNQRPKQDYQRRKGNRHRKTLLYKQQNRVHCRQETKDESTTPLRTNTAVVCLSTLRDLVSTTLHFWTNMEKPWGQTKHPILSWSGEKINNCCRDRLFGLVFFTLGSVALVEFINSCSTWHFPYVWYKDIRHGGLLLKKPEGEMQVKRLGGRPRCSYTTQDASNMDV